MTACLDTSPTRVRALRRLCLCLGATAAGLALAGAGPVRAQSASSPAASSPFRAAPPPGRELQHRLVPAAAGAPTAPRVALTLDACMGATDTALIDFLVREQIPASVFVTARWLAANPLALRTLRAHPDVFELENHGERHVPAVIGAEHRVYGLPGAADLQALRREVREGARAIEAATGRAPVWFRAATARYDEQALQELARLGVRIAGFSLNADAGGTLAAAEVATRVGRARDGDVILAHLNRPGSGTRAGLEQALPLLRRMGFTFVHLGTRALVEVGARPA